MAVVTVSFKAAGLSTDSRFKSWAKLFCDKNVDLTKEGGYAIGGAFCKSGEAVPMDVDDYLVYAAQTGSRKYVSYRYALTTVDDAGQQMVVDEFIIINTLAEAKLADKVEAKQRNSELYRYAAYVSVMGQRRAAMARAEEVLHGS